MQVSEQLLWHLLAHAKLKPVERIEVLRVARALNGEVADLTVLTQAGYPGISSETGQLLKQLVQASDAEGVLLEKLAGQGVKYYYWTRSRLSAAI